VINIASGAVGKKGKTHISLQVERKMFIFCVHTHTHIWAKGQRNQFPLRDEESRLAAGKDDEATQTQTIHLRNHLVLFTFERIVVHPELVSFLFPWRHFCFIFFLKKKNFPFSKFSGGGHTFELTTKRTDSTIPNHLDFEASFLLTLHSCWCVCVCSQYFINTKIIPPRLPGLSHTQPEVIESIENSI
jgi:hypothetical protein